MNHAEILTIEVKRGTGPPNKYNAYIRLVSEGRHTRNGHSLDHCPHFRSKVAAPVAAPGPVPEANSNRVGEDRNKAVSSSVQCSTQDSWAPPLEPLQKALQGDLVLMSLTPHSKIYPRIPPEPLPKHVH